MPVTGAIMENPNSGHTDRRYNGLVWREPPGVFPAMTSELRRTRSLGTKTFSAMMFLLPVPLSPMTCQSSSRVISDFLSMNRRSSGVERSPGHMVIPPTTTQSQKSMPLQNDHFPDSVKPLSESDTLPLGM